MLLGDKDVLFSVGGAGCVGGVCTDVVCGGGEQAGEVADELSVAGAVGGMIPFNGRNGGCAEADSPTQDG